MLTISQLAKQFGLSRATLLYYEREGLLSPSLRAENGYRYYTQAEVERLKSIHAYRSYGLPVATIGDLLAHKDRDQVQILREHFNDLEREIQNLRSQQKAIVLLLQQPNLLEENTVDKQRWVAIMQAAGFSEEDMIRWHQKFEEMEPAEHQKFLESLGIGSDEIDRIRAL